MSGPSGRLYALLAASAIAACAHTAPPAGIAAPRAGACRREAPVCGIVAPTYAGDVRPSRARRCFKCHAGDGVAADDHDFSRVETLRAQSAALTTEVGACAMPPSSEPPLPDAEAAVLLQWAACARSRPRDAVPERGP